MDESRLKKLEKIKTDELQEIKKLMLLRKRAAYHETMLGEYHLVTKSSQKY